MNADVAGDTSSRPADKPAQTPATAASTFTVAGSATESHPDPHAAVSRFARKVAHDLNNYATVIRTYSELALAELPNDSDLRSDIAEIHRAADAMASYVRRIAKVSRQAASLHTLADPQRVLAEIVASLAVSSASPRVALDTAPDTPVGELTVDHDWLSESVHELITNAVEASPAGHAVRVGWRAVSIDRPALIGRTTVPRGHWAHLRVCDSGEGFAASVQENAEEPFATTKEGERGAGFGLTCAFNFARAHRGHLTRERIDHTTTVVSLWLPLS